MSESDIVLLSMCVCGDDHLRSLPFQLFYHVMHKIKIPDELYI